MTDVYTPAFSDDFALILDALVVMVLSRSASQSFPTEEINDVPAHLRRAACGGHG